MECFGDVLDERVFGPSIGSSDAWRIDDEAAHPRAWVTGKPALSRLSQMLNDLLEVCLVFSRVFVSIPQRQRRDAFPHCGAGNEIPSRLPEYTERQGRRR